MSILSGFKSIKKYILTSTGYKLLSQVTQAKDIIYQDGKNAQQKTGSINGVVTTFNGITGATDNSLVASATAVKETYNALNSNLTTLFKTYTLTAGTLDNDCNNLPLNSVGYTYAETKNAPCGTLMILTYGLSGSYKVQIGISIITGQRFSRGFNDGIWSTWIQ